MKNKILGREARSRGEIRKLILTFAALLILCVILQTTVFARWRWFGIIPDLTFAVVVCLACFCGAEAGAICGIAGGFLIEALGGTGLAVLPVVYFLLGYFVGYFAKKRPDDLRTYAITCASTLPVHAFVTVFYTLVNYHKITGRTFTHILLPETAALVILFACLYFPMKKLAAWVER